MAGFVAGDDADGHGDLQRPDAHRVDREARALALIGAHRAASFRLPAVAVAACACSVRLSRHRVARPIRRRRRARRPRPRLRGRRSPSRPRRRARPSRLRRASAIGCWPRSASAALAGRARTDGADDPRSGDGGAGRRRFWRASARSTPGRLWRRSGRRSSRPCASAASGAASSTSCLSSSAERRGGRRASSVCSSPAAMCPCAATPDPAAPVATRDVARARAGGGRVPTRPGAAGAACPDWTPIVDAERTLAWVCTTDTRPVSGLYYAFARTGGTWKLTRVYALPD